MFCKSDSKGFTIIEILVAIVLFAFGALLAARMQTTSMRSTTFGKEALVATTAAQALLEQLKDLQLTPFATILAGGGPVTARPDTTPANIQAGTGGTQPPLVSGMTIQWTATGTAGTTGSRYTTVTVNVLWAGNTRNYTTTTCISEQQ